MKKISVLIALLLIITIGGVYATWYYAGTDDIADSYTEAKVTLEDAELIGSNGTFKITSNLVLTVDQANTEHEAKLVYSSNDGQPINITMTFTPSENAPQDIKDNAVPAEFYFTTTTPMQYPMDADGNYDADGTPVDIFNFSNPSDNTFTPNVNWGEPDENGVFTVVIPEDQVKQIITLSRVFVLDIKAEHEAFRTCLNGNILARLSDGNTTT